MATGLPGTLIELHAEGSIGPTLWGQFRAPGTMTPWHSVVSKITPSARELVLQTPTEGVSAFGAKRLLFAVPPHADLITKAWVVFRVPGIGYWRSALGSGDLLSARFMNTAGDVSGNSADGTTEPDEILGPRYTNALGFHLLQKVELVAGESALEPLWGVAMYVHEELAGRPGRRLGEQIAKFDSPKASEQLSRNHQRLYVPLPFTFGEHTGVALPAIQAQLSKLAIRMDLASRDSCVVAPTADTSASVAAGGVVSVRPDRTRVLSSRPRALADSDLDCQILFSVVVLSEEERFALVHRSSRYLFTETHVRETVVHQSQGGAVMRLNAKFPNAVRELQVAVRRQEAETSKDWFNFGGYDDIEASTLIQDPVLELGLELDTKTRFPLMDARTYRLAVNTESHTRIPEMFVYVVPFGQELEEPDSGGACLMAGIKQATLLLKLDPQIFSGSSTTARVFVIARCYNEVVVSEGLMARKHL